MAKRTKQKKQKKQTAKKSRAQEPSTSEKVPRLAHKILTQMIWPANLKLEEAIDVVTMVVKGLVLSNTSDESDEDLEDRSGMIAWIEECFTTALAEIDPFADPAHAWIVAPQGLITEPVGILWSGAYEDGSVQVVLGEELALLRAEIAESQAAVIVTEGVEGVAITDPEWDGEDTITCDNPQCGKIHDVHLMVAENLFEHAKQHAEQRAASN